MIVDSEPRRVPSRSRQVAYKASGDGVRYEGENDWNRPRFCETCGHCRICHRKNDIRRQCDEFLGERAHQCPVARDTPFDSQCTPLAPAKSLKAGTERSTELLHSIVTG